MEARNKGARPSAPITLLASAAIFFLISLDTLIVNVALPTISAELGGNMVAQQWVVDGYTLAFASFLLLMGSLSDRLGARRMFVLGTLAFGAASVFCSFAASMEMLVVGRVLLGLAAAAVLPPSMAVIREAYQDESKRARALGLWMSGGAAAGAAGPLLGGILTPIHWTLVFWVNVPLCLIIAVLAVKIAPSRPREAKLDPAGQLLATVGIVALVGGVIELGARGVGDPVSWGLVAFGAVLLALFFVVEDRVAAPMMPLGLFASRGMRLALWCGFVHILSWFGTVFLITQFLQQELGLTPFAAGLAFVPGAVASVGGNVVAGRAAARYGSRLPMMVGMAIEAVGLVLLAFAGSSMDLLAATLLVSLVGLGGSVAMPCASNVVLATAPAGQSGIASAVFNTFRQVGASVGIAIFGAFVAQLPTFGLALGASFALAAVLAAAAVILCLRPKVE